MLLIFLAGIAVGCAIFWPLGKNYGATEAETNWLRLNAEKECKSIPISYVPEKSVSYEIFDKKVAAKMKRTTNMKRNTASKSQPQQP